MTYPETWPVGAVVGRNLVPHPKFPAGSTERGAWQTGSPADREGTYAGAGLGITTETRIVLDGLTVADDAGAMVTVDFHYLATVNSQPAGLVVTGTGGRSSPITGHTLEVVPLPQALEYSWVTATFPLPSGPFRNKSGNTIEPTTYDLIVYAAGTAQLRISAVRVDYAGSPAHESPTVPYLDGDVDLGPDFQSAWDGTPGASATTVLALIGTEPEPEPDPDPDPEPDPEPDPGPDPGTEPDPAGIATLAAELAPSVAAFIGRPDDEETARTAEAAIPVVLEFVRGYTRGRGWHGYVPPYPLRAVIVSAAARIVANPRQVRQYAIADYSETPAALNGYTLAELGVLRRYRRTTA